MRMSGHLETLLILLEQTIEDENILSNSISKLFTLVAESIRKEDKTIEMIMKSVSFTIICEIGDVIQIYERFFLTQLDPERHSLLLGEFNQRPKNKIVCKNTVANFSSICNFIEVLLGDAIADHYLQVKRFVHMSIEDILCYMLSFLYHLSNNYHEYECL